MIVVYPFSLVDQELALKNARWMKELGGCKGHEVLVIHDARCHLTQEIASVLSGVFDKVDVRTAPQEIDGWPQGANHLFCFAATLMQTRPNIYWFWLEPDAIPLESGWLDTIEKEFRSVGIPRGKRFMGDRVQVGDIPLHMSGVGIYPNPLHAYSGDAYRAHTTDVAWDMMGRGQIVPLAHFTTLIEHAWKHPSFSSHAELASQIAKGTILFHSSKDGSLIDLLRSASQDMGLEKTTQVSASNYGTARQKEPEEPGSPAPVCDIFIRTYPGDYGWLQYCLRSINKFCSGFRRIVIVSPQDMPLTGMGYEWKTMQDESEDGYLAQQITKMYADVITDYQPDFILHVDSDVVFARPTRPEHFFNEGKAVWYYTPYSEIETPWKPIIEKFMQKPVEFEFMRRLPIMVPRWLYPRIREFCHKTHGMIVSDYIRTQPLRAFSEFNVMGAYAWQYHREMFDFVNTMDVNMPVPVAKQFHSWGGLTDEIRRELETILSGGSVELPPAGEAGAVTPPGDRSQPLSPQPPAGIKDVNGIWIIADDSHVGRWIVQQGRLDHDQNTLPFILPLINEGDIVIDGGAFVGDHTIAYSRKVGPKGRVYGFEPNPLAVQCAVHNLHGLENTVIVEKALGDRNSEFDIGSDDNNCAGAYLKAGNKVQMARLDDYCLAPHFIKLDIEGCEVKALIGAQQTIIRCRPIMVIEVNVSALDRQGATVGQLLALLESYGYDYKVMQENCDIFSPMFDLICVHKKVPEAARNGDGADLTRCAAPPPASYTEAIEFLQKEAAKSPKHRWRVMYDLYKAGLTPKKNKGHKKIHARKPDKKDIPLALKPTPFDTPKGSKLPAKQRKPAAKKGLVQTDQP